MVCEDVLAALFLVLEDSGQCMMVGWEDSLRTSDSSIVRFVMMDWCTLEGWTSGERLGAGSRRRSNDDVQTTRLARDGAQSCFGMVARKVDVTCF